MAGIYRITGQDGSNEPFFQMDVPAGKLGKGGIVALLERLAARHLSDEEIVAASLKPNAAGFSAHLEVTRPSMKAVEQGFAKVFSISPNVTYDAEWIETDR